MSLVKFDVSRNSPKWTLNSSGNLASGSDNLPGFEYNPDGSYKGLLVEPARTNLCLQSEDWSVSPWIAYTAGAGLTPVVTADAGTAPDGTNNATRVQLDCDDDTVSANRSAWRQPITISNSTEYTVSFWYKAYDSSAIGDTVRVEHSRFASVGLRLITLTDDWQRYSFTGTSTGTSTSFLIETRGTTTGQTADILVWGAQLEVGEHASSYIPTTTTSVTRNEDVITLNNSSAYLPTVGKVTLAWEQRKDDTIYVGALSASISSGSRELVFEYSNTEQKLYIDNILKDSITGTFDFSDMDKIELGHVNGSSQPNTHLKYFAIE